MDICDKNSKLIQTGITPQQIIHEIVNLRQLIFEVTDSCNLKCKYCGYGEFYDNHDPRKKNSFPVKRAIVLLNYLTELWKSNRNTSYFHEIYISFYGGEPLINTDFIKTIISFINKIDIQGKKFIYSMTTNAMLLDQNMDFLVDNNFKLLISLDGNSYNQSYRLTYSGKNSFEKVYSNVKLLQKKYPTYFKNNVEFNAVLHNRNSVSEIYQFIQSEFGKIPRIAELNTSGIQKDKQKLFWETYRNKEESLKSVRNSEDIQNDLFIESPKTWALGIFLHQYSGNVFRSYNDLLIDNKTKNYFPTGTCIPFSKKMFVTVKGKILPCERIGHQYSMGSVTDNEVLLDYEQIAKEHNAKLNKLKSQCSKCYNVKACVQCIFNLDNLDERPICKNYMDKNSFYNYCNSQMEYLEKHPYLYKRIMEEVLIK